jgi:hypothetical protein
MLPSSSPSFEDSPSAENRHHSLKSSNTKLVVCC